VSAPFSPVPPGSSEWPAPSDGLYRSLAGLVDSPTERLPDPVDAPPGDAPAATAPRRPRGRWAVVAVLLALLALVAAAGSAAVAWQALDRADAATSLAQRLQRRELAGSTTDAPPVAPSAGSSAQPAADPSAEAGLKLDTPAGPGASASPAAEYTAGYASESLKFQIGCSAVLFVDLDEPRANVDDEHHDLRYTSRCGANAPSLALGPGAEGGSEATADTRTAEECARQIRTSPLGPRAGVPVRANLKLCVLTSLADAEQRGDTQKLILLEVTTLSDQGTAGLRATSWIVG
jgi:hypothetical protein